MVYTLQKSNRKNKKFVIIMDDNMKHHFGLKDGKTFIDGRTEKERQNYIARHKVNENWEKSGIHTAGFWSRWVLWNKPTLKDSIKDIEKKYNIKIQNKI